MSIEMDSDVERAMCLLQSTFPASRLVAIAQQIGAIGPALWGRYRAEEIEPLRLRRDLPTSALLPADDPRTQSAASE